MKSPLRRRTGWRPRTGAAPARNRAPAAARRRGNRAELCNFGRVFSQRTRRTGQWSAESVPHRCGVRRAIRHRSRDPAMDASGGTLS